MKTLFSTLVLAFVFSSVGFAQSLPPKLIGRFDYQGSHKILGIQLEDFIEIHKPEDDARLFLRQSEGFDCSENAPDHWYCYKIITDRKTDADVARAVQYDYGDFSIDTEGPLGDPQLNQENPDYTFWEVGQFIMCDGFLFQEAQWALGGGQAYLSLGPNEDGARFTFTYSRNPQTDRPQLALYRMFYLREGELRKVAHVLVDFLPVKN